MSKRKAYNPNKAARRSAATQYARENAVPLADDQIADLSIAFRIAFDLMITGHADEQQWSTCTVALNIALILAERGFGPHFVDDINAALEGAFRARVRAQRTGAWGYDGAAMTAIKRAFEIHEAQIENATRADLRAAIAEIRQRIDDGVVFELAAA